VNDKVGQQISVTFFLSVSKERREKKNFWVEGREFFHGIPRRGKMYKNLSVFRIKYLDYGSNSLFLYL